MSDANTTLRPESPLNQKGPVSEDLRAAMDAWLQNHPGRSLLAAEYLADGYLAGHSDGWNRCLDEVMKEIDLEVDNLMMSWKGSRAESLTKLKYRLEKLRR